MTDWYYGTGGRIYLSPRARQVYLKSKENLLCPESDIVPSGALDEFLDMDTDTKRGRLAIRQLSLLRWILRFDLDIHTEPYNAELTPKEIAFLKICDVDINKHPPFRGNWDRVATARNDRRGFTQ